MNRKSRILKMLTKTGLVVLAIAFCYPVLFLLTGSFMGQSELSENLGSVMGEATRYARWNFLPQNPTLKHYIEVLLDSPELFCYVLELNKSSDGNTGGTMYYCNSGSMGICGIQIQV